MEFGESYEIWNVGIWSGAPEVEYRWQHCTPPGKELECVDIPGAGDPSDYVPQAGDVGYRLRLRETATARGEEVTVYSQPTQEVSASISFEAESFGGPAVVGATITASNTFASGSGLPITVEYKFKRLEDEGPPVLLQEGTSPSYEIAEGDLGHELKIEAEALLWRIDEEVVVVNASSSVTTPQVAVPPTNDQPPFFMGDHVVGGQLLAEPGEWHGGGGSLDFAYQWQRCDAEGEGCEFIAEATQSAYKPTEEDEGARLRVAVTASHGEASGTASSVVGDPIEAGVAPENQEAPSISGETSELDVLTAEPGAWSGTEQIHYSYQWQGCLPDDPSTCLDIEEETGESLELGAAEVGESVRVIVTASNGGGSASAASELAGPITAAPAPELSALPSLSVLGPPTVGSTLVTDGGDWENVDPGELDYLWWRCDLDGQDCQEVVGSAGASYKLQEEDVGFRLQVEVNADNSSERVGAMSELSPEIGESEGSAEGKVVYLDGSAIYLSDLDGESTEQVADCDLLIEEKNCGLYGPRISPNRKLIAVEVRQEEAKLGEGAIFLMNTDGGEARLLAEGSQPSWSPDGTQVYMTAPDPEEEGGARVVAVAADGSDPEDPEVLFNVAGAEESPDLSPDEESIAYARRVSSGEGETRSEIYVGQLDGSSTIRMELGSGINEAFDPRFTADGKQIVFAAIPTQPYVVQYGSGQIQFGGLRGLWTIGVDGSNLRPLKTADGMTYGLPSVAGDEIFVDRQEATFIGGGFGGSYVYIPKPPLRMSLQGNSPQHIPIDDARELHVAHASSAHYTECRGRKRCLRWRVANRKAAQTYAVRWAYHRNNNYPSYDNDCTSFVSQAWRAGGHKYMRQFEYGEWSWWARGWAITPTESWIGVKFIEQQQEESHRARGLGPLPPSRWKLGDVIVYNWANGGPLWDHMSIVTRTGAMPAISQHSPNRENMQWEKMQKEIIPEYVREIGGNPHGWNYYVLRPRYRAANIPLRYR